MKFSKYNIDSQSLTNLDILNNLNKYYKPNYILQCADNICIFHNLLQSY